MKSRFLLFALVLGLVPMLASATVSEREVKELRDQISALSARLAALEAVSQTADEIVSAPGRETGAVKSQISADSGSWADAISFKGDFRYRYDRIDQDGSDARNRQRIRARPALTAIVTDDVRAGFGLATGGDDPVSTNQTLGAGGSSKGVVLDLAYFQWSGIENLKILGGKFKNPMYRPGGSSLVWDGDWRPEGLAATYSGGNLFGSAYASWLEGDSRRGEEIAFALQGGYAAELTSDMALTLGAGYYQANLAGREPLFDDSDSFGNSLAADGTYLSDFHIVSLMAEAKFALGDWPASVLLDYARNLDADAYDTGWSIGGTLGKASSPGSWGFSYAYQDLEADAVIGLLTDSDWGGGGTDRRGHLLTASYAIARNWSLKLSYFLNETGEDAVDRGDAGASERDYDRLLVDLGFKY